MSLLPPSQVLDGGTGGRQAGGATHQFMGVLLVVHRLLLQGVPGVQELLLQLTDLAETSAASCSASSDPASRPKLGGVYLSVRPLPVGRGGLILVPEQRLQLSDGAVQSGHLNTHHASYCPGHPRCMYVR